MPTLSETPAVVSRLTHLKGGRVHRVMLWVQPSATAYANFVKNT